MKLMPNTIIFVPVERTCGQADSNILDQIAAKEAKTSLFSYEAIRIFNKDARVVGWRLLIIDETSVVGERT